MSQYNPVPPTIPGPISSGGNAPNTTLWLVLSIVATLLCCLPAGIVAIVYSALAMGRVGANDFVMANKYIRNAKIWVIVSASISLVILVLYVVLVAVGAVAGGGGFGP